MSAAPRVVKLGGSLLDWPDWPAAFQRWVRAQPPAANVLVVGGGAIVDALRRLDQSHSLPPPSAHWLAIRAMGVTARLAAGLLPDAVLVERLEQLTLAQRGPVQVFDVEHFLREDAAGQDPLPATWDVTSDSIAARVARRIGASELVLLKSARPAGSTSRAALARSGYVDRHFPQASAGLVVRCENLRLAEPAVPLAD